MCRLWEDLLWTRDYDYEVETSRFILEHYVKLKVIKKVKVAASVLLWWCVCVYVSMETDFRLWLLGSWTSFSLGRREQWIAACRSLPPGRIYEFEIDVSNISGTVRNCESILMWIQQHKQSDHHVSLTQPDWIFAEIVFVLTFTWGWIWKQIWKPLWAWRLLILVKSIHTLKGQTLVHLAASLWFDMFVFCFASDELPVSQTSLTCRSFLFLVPLEWILINKDGFPNKSRGETFYIEQLVKVSAAPLPWSEPSVQKVIMFIVC